jgi:hypothetical protein
VSKFPDIVGLGSGRSGTTYIYYYLEQHPDVSIPVQKELNFFSSRKDLSEKDLDVYRQQLNFEEGKKSFEISPSYLWPEALGNSVTIKDVAANIARLMPATVPLFGILRSPAARAYSQFLFDIKSKKITRGCFYEELEKGRNSEQAFVLCNYLSDNIREVLDTLRKYHIEFFVNETDIGPQAHALRRVSELLGIELMKFEHGERINTTRGLKIYAPEKEAVTVNLTGTDRTPDVVAPSVAVTVQPGEVFFRTGWHAWNLHLSGLEKHELSDYRSLADFIGSPPTKEQEAEINSLYYRDEINQLQDLLKIDLSHWTSN